MIRHLFVAALRNMAANRLLSAISILGLAAGITVALLVAMVIRNQLGFDHFIPGYAHTYASVSHLVVPGHTALPPHFLADRRMASLIKLNVPDVEDTTRLMDKPVHIRRGQIAALETIYWADANAFAVLPMPVLRGNLQTALLRPDSIVMTQSAARKYFGRDDALGQAVFVDNHPMTLTAVIADLPANATELQSGIFASALAPYSGISLSHVAADAFVVTVETYVRLKPDAPIAATQARVTALLAKLLPKRSFQYTETMTLVRLDRLQLDEGLHPGATSRLMVMALIGALVLFIATANFINLTLARSVRREKEVGIRKANGANRRALIGQFLVEAFVAVVLAACFAMALGEWILPAANAFLQSGATLNPWGDPVLALGLLAGIVGLSLAAGAYPAFILSAFMPARTLKGWTKQTRVTGTIRDLLVIVQFAVLIGLIISSAVVWQQRRYVTTQRLGIDPGQILMVQNGCARNAFREAVRSLPGVLDAACASNGLLENDGAMEVRVKGQLFLPAFIPAQAAIFRLYGIMSLAGTIPQDRPGVVRSDVPVVINNAAARRFGFRNPAAAIGQTISLQTDEHSPAIPVQIAAVVPDTSLRPADAAVPPTVYSRGVYPADTLHLKIDGEHRTDTMAAIDRLWTATGGTGATPRQFLSDYMQARYLTILRQAELFAVFATVAVILACLGLFGIAVSTTERRIKEIGLRKVMGAKNVNIIALLLWQFSKPVLWANVIAWPVAWWAMQRWLSGFAYHVELQAWLFIAASVGTLSIALLTVAGQALLVARQKPVLALRYE